MPTYIYRCKRCNHEVEIMHSIKDAPRKKCPRCGKNGLRRMISGGGGIIFRGEPFSASTEYLSKNKGKKK